MAEVIGWELVAGTEIAFHTNPAFGTPAVHGTVTLTAHLDRNRESVSDAHGARHPPRSGDHFFVAEKAQTDES
jgi:hypothetical protein